VETSFDVLIIGGGPGGYVCAIRCAQLGMKVACVEKEDYLGGTCLKWGCIPSKTLLDSSELYHQAKHTFAKHGIKASGIELDLPAMMARKEAVVSGLTRGVASLFKKNKIESIRGTGRLLGSGKVEVTTPDASKKTLSAKNIIIATGSSPTPVKGIDFDGKHIISSNQAIGLDKVPAKLLIIGGGVIGLELGSVWSRLGSQVKVVEFLDRIAPAMDREMTTLLQRQLEKQGLTFQFKTAAKTATVKAGKVTVVWEQLEDGQPPKPGTDEADIVLVAVGRRPHTDGLGAKEAGVELDPRGFVKIDAHYKTSAPGVYAIGDVVGGLMLAHKAEEEGVALAEILAGQAGHVNYNAVPGVVYTDPELASVGKTEEELKAAGIDYRIGKFPLAANGRAKAMDQTDGVVKILGDAKTDRLLGMHILGPRASDLIAEGAIAVEFAATTEDIARSVHAHPTLPEAIKEAALAVHKRAIHF
jgi:dihydrolipoamide dehydrogenase